MKNLLQVLITFTVITNVADLPLDVTVMDVVKSVCKKTPFTRTKKCIKKKMKCINKDYQHGEELEQAVFDCF